MDDVLLAIVPTALQETLRSPNAGCCELQDVSGTSRTRSHSKSVLNQEILTKG